MSRETENAAFTCDHCGQEVVPLDDGSYRNHCPFCLFSKHVDVKPGDRQETCGGAMEPMGIHHKPGKGFQIIHRCRRCGAQRVNRIAASATQPDDIRCLMRLMLM